jgi:hypothetical protein
VGLPALDAHDLGPAQTELDREAPLHAAEIEDPEPLDGPDQVLDQAQDRRQPPLLGPGIGADREDASEVDVVKAPRPDPLDQLVALALELGDRPRVALDDAGGRRTRP